MALAPLIDVVGTFSSIVSLAMMNSHRTYQLLEFLIPLYRRFTACFPSCTRQCLSTKWAKQINVDSSWLVTTSISLIDFTNQTDSRSLLDYVHGSGRAQQLIQPPYTMLQPSSLLRPLFLNTDFLPSLILPLLLPSGEIDIGTDDTSYMIS